MAAAAAAGEYYGRTGREMWHRLGEIRSRDYIVAGRFVLIANRPLHFGSWIPETYKIRLGPYATVAGYVIALKKAATIKPLLFARDETEALKTILKKLRPLL